MTTIDRMNGRAPTAASSDVAQATTGGGVVRYTMLSSQLGELLVTDHGDGISGLYFPGHRRGPVVGASWIEDDERFRELGEALERYLDGDATDIDVTLDLRGTAFQRRVWAVLRGVRFGCTISYGTLASLVGQPGSARAVAAAVARNPVSIVVPCHRVVGTDGTLTGYAGGIDRKRELLALEQPTPRWRGPIGPRPEGDHGG